MSGKIFDFLVSDGMLDFLWYQLRIGKKAINRRIEREFATKKENCAKGWHVPVRMYVHESNPGVFSDDDEYWCQECSKTMTREEWETYFSTPKMQEMIRERRDLFGR